MTSIRPRVATTSETKCGPGPGAWWRSRPPPRRTSRWPGRPHRCTRPPGRAVGRGVPPLEAAEAASTKETTGLKWAPEIGPNIKMMAKSPAAVAAAFSKSWSPISPGERLLGGDPRADDDGGQEGAPQELGEEPPPQDGVPHAAPRRSLGQRPAGAQHRPGRTARARRPRGRSTTRPRRCRSRPTRRRGRCRPPRRAVGVVDPHLVLDGVAAVGCSCDLGRRVRRRPGGPVAATTSSVVSTSTPRWLRRRRCRGLERRVLDQDQLERRVGDGEVGVAGPDLGRLGVEQFRVEVDGLVEVGDIEGKLDTGHGGPPIESTSVDASIMVDTFIVVNRRVLHGQARRNDRGEGARSAAPRSWPPPSTPTTPPNWPSGSAPWPTRCASGS